MATVHTATGPIDSADLGNVLVHEHVFVLGEEFRQNYQDDWDEDDKVAEAVRDLYRADTQPEQSYSERQLYEAALDRLTREVAAVSGIDEAGAQRRVGDVLTARAA